MIFIACIETSQIGIAFGDMKYTRLTQTLPVIARK